MAMGLAAAMGILCCACQSQSESTDTSDDASTFDAYSKNGKYGIMSNDGKHDTGGDNDNYARYKLTKDA